MRRGIVNDFWLVLLLTIPAAGRLLGFTQVNSDSLKKIARGKTLPSGALQANESRKSVSNPMSHELPPAVVDRMRKIEQGVPEVPQQACPSTCACYAGDPNTGGSTLVGGMCFKFCSAAHEGWRYCGDGPEYHEGDSIDCQRCVEPQFFGATTKIYDPLHGTPERSLILLGPWNGSQGDMYNWTIKDSQQLDQTRNHVRKTLRIVDVRPKPMPGTNFHAWYGYAGDRSWWKDRPIAAEVDVAVAYIHHLIEAEYQVVGDYKRILLGGLSQGGNLAIEAALRFPKELGLVLSDRGVIFANRLEKPPKGDGPWATQARQELVHGSTNKHPFTMFMGEEDHYYGVDLAKKSCRYLRTVGIPVFMRAVPGLDHDAEQGRGRDLERKLTWDTLAAVIQTPLNSTLAVNAIRQVTDWTACA